MYSFISIISFYNMNKFTRVKSAQLSKCNGVYPTRSFIRTLDNETLYSVSTYSTNITSKILNSYASIIFSRYDAIRTVSKCFYEGLLE